MILLQPAALPKVTLLRGCFPCFLNCTNDTKSCKAFHLIWNNYKLILNKIGYATFCLKYFFLKGSSCKNESCWKLILQNNSQKNGFRIKIKRN